MSQEGRRPEGQEAEEGSCPWWRCLQKAPAALTKAKGRRTRLNSSRGAAATGLEPAAHRT